MTGEGEATAGGMELRLRLWRPVRSAKLRGFAAVDLPCGLQIAEIMLLAGPEGLYARLPQRPTVRGGVQVKSNDGALLWDAPIVWRSRRFADEFSAAVVAAVRRRAPADLEE